LETKKKRNSKLNVGSLGATNLSPTKARVGEPFEGPGPQARGERTSKNDNRKKKKKKN